MSKVITWLWVLCLVIDLKDSCQFFNQWKAKPIAPCSHGFSRASSKLRVIARNYCDWFMALFVPVVIGQSDYFGFGFSTVIWKLLYIKYFDYYSTSGFQSIKSSATEKRNAALKFPNAHLCSGGRKVEKDHQNVLVLKEKSSFKHVSSSETFK